MNLPFRIQVKFEARAPNGTLCGDWRREGYARQQYSNFYGNFYTDAEYVAIIDTDTEIIAPGKGEMLLPVIKVLDCCRRTRSLLLEGIVVR